MNFLPTPTPITRRDVVKMAVAFQHPPYVPWSFYFTKEARAKLERHYGTSDIETTIGNHFVLLGDSNGYFEDIGNNRCRDLFGVVWDRSIDEDIGNVEGQVLATPSLAGYRFPDPTDQRHFRDIPKRLACFGDCYRLYCVGFSLFERAWSLRGIEALYMDFMENPDFVHDLLAEIASYNIAQVRRALEYDIDAVYFGDDWGQQHGLLMGYKTWKTFLYPMLAQMYDVVRSAGKTVFIHSCGDVDELFPDLIALGVRVFNPFQPEVMDVAATMRRHHGQLAFWGGVSTQRTMPFGSTDEVRAEVRRMIFLGKAGGYILAPSHAIEGDVPLENMLALITEAQAQLPA